ncbi:MAG: hypothetical protein Q7T55_11145, partial [Solirubrobacteraceae bacterium]|nr:hypothetical protein [Solirubrobacteraceae bacterium]
DGLLGNADTLQLAANTGTGVAGVRATTASGGLWGIDVDQTTHEAWFSEYGSSNVESPAGSGNFPGNRVARAGSSLGVTELPNLAVRPPSTTIDSLRYDAQPKGIVADGAGGAWFAQASPGNPGWRVARAHGTAYDEYQVTPCKPMPPCSGSYTGTGITDVALAKDGSVWFTNELDNTVGRLDTGPGTFTQYAMTAIDPSFGNSKPRAIRLAPDGALWVAQSNSPYVKTSANALVRIVPGQSNISATVYKTGANASFALAPAANGDVWFTASTATGTGRLGRIAAGGSSPTPSPTPVPGSPTPTPVPGAPTPTPNPLDPSEPLFSPAPTQVPAAVPAPTPTPIVVAPTTVGRAEVGKVNTTGDTVNSNQICVGPPADKCSLIYLIQTHEYVKGFPGTGARLSAPGKTPKKKPKEVVLGKLEFTMNGGETKKVKVRLSAKARKALASQKRIRATLVVQQKNKEGVFVQVKKQPVTFTAKKAK